MRVKVARRYQITIPEEVREEVGINVGEAVDVRSQDGKVVVEKVGKSWESVMQETKGVWKTHPIFKDMKDSIEIVDWLRQRHYTAPDTRQHGEPCDYPPGDDSDNPRVNLWNMGSNRVRRGTWRFGQGWRLALIRG